MKNLELKEENFENEFILEKCFFLKKQLKKSEKRILYNLGNKVGYILGNSIDKASISISDEKIKNALKRYVFIRESIEEINICIDMIAYENKEEYEEYKEDEISTDTATEKVKNSIHIIETLLKETIEFISKM
jgi:hypothetical protein